MGDLDRAKGALLGLAVGDAVGTTLEFLSPGEFEPIDDMVGGGPFNLKPGQWTDDTSMALCLGESLIRMGGHDAEDQLRTYVRWWKHGHNSSKDHCFDIGGQTRTALDKFSRVGAPPKLKLNAMSAGNGSLMRLAPVSIKWHNHFPQLIENAALSSETTHNNVLCVDSCKLLATMTATLIQGAEPDAVFTTSFWDATWDFGQEAEYKLHPFVDNIARGSWQNDPPRIKGTGYCIDSLEAAIWAVAGATDYKDAILRAANLGDDADTTAAIAGQMAGAKWGMSGIPQEWLDKLYRRADIEEMANTLFVGFSA